LQHMTAIRLEHVSKSFPRKAEVGISKRGREWREVLKDVTFELGEGEVVCILGRNGSGKTTLIRILSTLIGPDRGVASVSGFDVVREPDEVRKRIGVVLNSGEGGFHWRLSAQANLEYYAALYGIPGQETRARIAHLLKDLGLEERGADQYQSYSTGMRRRVALVRSLLPDAPVLLLDEPTLGVDPWSAERIHNYLRELSKQGKTILCATNNPAEARALGVRHLMLEEGVMLPSKTEEVLAA
jgi:ABC-2 type transport system ATP-binding protein